jgi:hypothetical protein
VYRRRHTAIGTVGERPSNVLAGIKGYKTKIVILGESMFWILDFFLEILDCFFTGIIRLREKVVGFSWGLW